MSTISWITPAGLVANLLIGVETSIDLQARDSNNPGANITYSLVYGDLPDGLTLSTNGVISGIPTHAESAYFTTVSYSFHVRAQSGATSQDRSFSITLSNVVNRGFAWVTPSGSLGTIPVDKFYSFQLRAENASNLPITYSFISGELPTNMQLLSNGTLEGVPEFNTPLAIGQSKTYRFTVRATSQGSIIDNSFSINLSSVFGPTIQPATVTGPYLIGEYFDGTYISEQLVVTELSPEIKATWSIKSGTLPPGLKLDKNTGLLSGYIEPASLIGDYGPQGFDGGLVAGDIITAGNFSLGYSYIITTPGTTDFTSIGAADNNPGTTFTATGNGYGTGTAEYTGSRGDAHQYYDYGPLDFNEVNQSLNYNFTVQAFDGANYDLQSYLIKVVARSSFTADTTITDDVTYITIDASDVYIPVLLDTSAILPEGRQASYYAYKFKGYDFGGDTVTYSLALVDGTFDANPFDPLDRDDFNNGLAGSFDVVTDSGIPNLPGIRLDSQTGWLYGRLSPQISALENYKFGIVVSKVVDGITYSSQPKYFTLPVLGDINDTVNWITPSNLGLIDNGSVSEVSVKASSPLGKNLVYELVDEPTVSAWRPQGLLVLSSGDISGRVSFEAFAVDDYAMTFDGGTTTIDRLYTFTVKATTVDGTASSKRTFTLKLNVIDQKPYVNLYLKSMPAIDQRQIYNSVISDTEIFDPNLIYRPLDPWFGINQRLDMLFLPGLNSAGLETYQQAIIHNHWTKKYNFGAIKTAVVLDEYYKVKYEVVYIQIVDPEENAEGHGAPIRVDLTRVNENPYYDATGNAFKVIYPNSSENMISQLVNNIEYYDQSSLPPWMTSNQLINSTDNTFNPPIGYTQAVVLAYTIPGASKLIAYRLRSAGINFKNIEFRADRYLVDDYYSKNFDVVKQHYAPSKLTTFDVQPKNNIGTIVAQVNYAVSLPFDQINNRPIEYVNSLGGLDGIPVTDFDTPGKTLIFAQQENFLNAGPYGGWVNYTDGFIGDNVDTIPIEGYDSENYDQFSLIPGYLEKLLGPSTAVNQRGGVWQISIINNLVVLTFLKEIFTFDRVRIMNGRTYGTAVMYYATPTRAGQTVPSYQVYRLSKDAIKNPTTFNAGTTRFFNNRDTYYVPNDQDKYLKFPQTGAFN